MKKFIFLLLLFPLIVAAQDGRRDSTRQQRAPGIGSIVGTVKDADNGEGIAFAAVAVLRVNDSTIAGGGQTNEKGNFLITGVPPGRFILRVSFVGYHTAYSEPVNISMQNPETDAGIISVRNAVTNLETVTITGEKSEYVKAIDRKIYNVEKNIVNTGGAVTEVLQNIPSVAVDMDGNVSLRGSENVTILIDGKPSGMLGGDRRAALQQIPASAVDQIEVITNPSARFDAEGMAGIINIKTKKEKLKGMNGNVSVSVGTNDKYNITTSVNNRSPRMNLYGSYVFRHDERNSTGESNQFNFLPSQPPYSYFTESSGTDVGNNHTGKIGADFFINKFNTLGVNGSVSTRDETDRDQVFYEFLDSDGVIFDSFYRNNHVREDNLSYEINADHKKTWKDSKRELTSSAGYSSNRRDDFSRYMSNSYSFVPVPFQLSDNSNHYQNLTAQADFIEPMKKDARFETGVKATNRAMDNEQFVSDYDPLSGVFLENPNISDRFSYNEFVGAAYALYSGTYKKFDFNAGLRAEQSLTEIKSASMNEKYNNEYFSLFPSAFLKYNLSDKNDIQISYSRRINRPWIRALNPHVDYSDSLNLRTGNPFLKPEFIHSAELAYSHIIKKFNVSASVYYRHTDDLISRFRMVDSLTGIGTLTTINYSTSQNIGTELILRYTFEKAGSVMGSFNLYNNKINGDNISADLQSESVQWSARLNANLRISPTIGMQVTGFYHAPREHPNGRIKAMSGVDAGIRKDIWKGKGTVSLNVTDIFYTRVFRFHNFDDFYESNGTRRRESRVATFTLSYMFGSEDRNIFQRKKGMRQESGAGQEEMIDY